VSSIELVVKSKSTKTGKNGNSAPLISMLVILFGFHVKGPVTDNGAKSSLEVSWAEGSVIEKDTTSDAEPPPTGDAGASKVMDPVISPPSVEIQLYVVSWALRLETLESARTDKKTNAFFIDITIAAQLAHRRKGSQGLCHSNAGGKSVDA
jgi:hypothetical protein